MTADYDEHYWHWLRQQGYAHEDITEQLRIATEQARAFIRHAGGVAESARILDYGCGQGALTAGLRKLGYKATGVDVSPWPIEHSLPQAAQYVQLLGGRGLAEFAAGSFDLAIAKDVLEHIDEALLPDIVAELLRIAPKLLFLCPVTDAAHRFICPGDEEDATHITRLTRQEWLTFFPYKATEQADVPALVHGAENAHGSVCVLLER